MIYQPTKICCGYDYAIFTLDKYYVCGVRKFPEYQKFISNIDIELIDSGWTHIVVLKRSPNEIFIMYDKEEYTFSSINDKITSIDSGMDYSIISTKSGQLYGWGKNDSGQLGLGNYDKFQESFQKVVLHQNMKIISISCGGFHTISLDTLGNCHVWGRNDFGQLGLGDINNRNLPQELKIRDVVSVCGGGFHTTALTLRYKVYIWGCNDEGQLGFGCRQENKSLPKKLNLENVVSIRCGRCHTVALTSFDKIYVWGSNVDGQLGLNNIFYQSIPRPLTMDHYSKDEHTESIYCGAEHTYFISSVDKIYVLGNKKIDIPNAF